MSQTEWLRIGLTLLSVVALVWVARIASHTPAPYTVRVGGKAVATYSREAEGQQGLIALALQFPGERTELLAAGRVVTWTDGLRQHQSVP